MIFECRLGKGEVIPHVAFCIARHCGKKNRGIFSIQLLFAHQLHYFTLLSATVMKAINSQCQLT